MEHMITLTFNLEDDRIQDQMEKAAVAEVIKRFDQAVIKAATRQRGYYYNAGKSFEETVIDYLQANIDKFIQEHSGVIIEAAGKQLAEKLSRTKRARELLEQGG